MTSLAVGTVVGRNYLPFARVLARSLHEHHPGVQLVVVVADGGPEDPHDSRQLFSSLTPEELPVPDLNRLRFRCTRQELVVALKPFLLTTLLEGAPSALFIDADVLVLGRLDELFGAIHMHSVTLVPHALEPPKTPDGIERDLLLNLSGAFNGGVVGVSRSPETLQFLTWWQKRVHRRCVHDVKRGMHFDQRWLDLAPGFVEDLHVCRDAGVNVAHWNLPERPIRIQDGTVTAGGVPCRLFHFSGFDPDNPERATRYRPGLPVDGLGQAEQLFRNYARELESAGWRQSRLLRYGYGSFNNGVRIPAAARRLYAELPEACGFGNPFDAAPVDSYFRWLRRRLRGPRGFRCANRLWFFIYQQRPDLQRAFPYPEGADRRAFLAWTRTHGTREHEVSPELA